MRKVLTYFIASVCLMVSCQREDFGLGQGSEQLDLSFRVQIPDMTQIRTKAVDPDGGGIQHIILYCFDEYGLFITTTTLTGDSHTPDGSNPSLSGTFKATVPDHTKTVHIVGNQLLMDFDESEYRDKSEYEVMSGLEASAGRMIYWARVTVDQLKALQTSGEPVQMLRNQAKITVEVSDGIPFDIDGFVVTNTSAFGTVAPYDNATGSFVAPTSDNPFVTIPENDVKLGDFQAVRGNLEEYVFETANNIEDPVNVIMKGSYDGGLSLYYRVVLMDSDGDQLRLLRNHHYTVKISDKLSYGQATFAEAMTAPATNNVWITVEDHVTQIHGLEHILSVDKASVVVDESDFLSPNLYSVYYTLERVDGAALTAGEKPQVTWMDGNDVAYNGFIHDFNTSTGRGTLTLTLHSMGNLSKREGTLLIKTGRLYRKIKITTIKKQSFTPAWASTQVYGHETGEHLTLMFTIPEDCPAELFPLEVLISTNILDVRHEAGQELPVRLEMDAGDDFYGEPNDWGYKYVYTVTAPGKQRLYLENILVQTGGQSVIRVEADHFNMLEKHFTFSSEAVNRSIVIHGLQSYSAVMPADDPIYYYLVPQKVNAHVEFRTHVGELYDAATGDTDGTIVSGGETKYVNYTPIGDTDEFLFYSRYLSHDTSPHECDFTFYSIDQENWGSGGRVHGFIKQGEYYEENYGMTFHMHTNSSRSEEVIRIASNPNGQPSVTGSGTCSGQQYRSVIFELGNYHPFSFAARIGYGDAGMTGTVGTGATEEKTDVLTWSYVPYMPVDISFDITSFRGGDGKSVDPFGTEFEVYIDAPMLELGALPANLAGKVKADPDVKGRFIYTVEADRDAERAYGSSAALLADQTGADQTGERKTIPFRVKDIVSAGDITISSQEDTVVFYKKTFRVQNESIRGRLQYQNGTLSDVPAEAFVVLERMKTFNRIGTVTVSDLSDGSNMDIRLRSEYTYSWYNDPVKIQYARTNGSETVVYEKIFDSLDALYTAASAGPIVLSHQ